VCLVIRLVDWAVYFVNCVELEKIRNIDVFTVDTTINNLRNSELIVATISLKQIDGFWQSTKKAFPISPRIVKVSSKVRISPKTINTFTFPVSYFISSFALLTYP
jgi:hypothetical protein